MRCVFENIPACRQAGELISLTGSAGGRAKTEPLFRPPRLACPTEAVRRREAEAKRTISSFSNPPLADCSVLPSLAAKFIFYLKFPLPFVFRLHVIIYYHFHQYQCRAIIFQILLPIV